MSDIKNKLLAAIIREQLSKEKGKITAEYLKNKLSSTDSSLRYGDFIALSYIINEALEQEPTLLQNLDNLNNLNNLNKLDKLNKLEDFIAHHEEIQQILGHESPGIPSSPANTNPAGPTEKKKKREKKKIAETQIILNKMIDNIIIYKQPVNSRSL